jgi:hypothetical protein
MSISRRDFMRLVGVSVASLSLTRCRFLPLATCYAPMPPTPTGPASARERLRLCWLSFGELAQATSIESKKSTPSEATTSENAFGQELVSKHRQALDEAVAAGELTPAVADLVQEAYEAAVYHVWRSNAPMTCYAPVIVDYAPVSADTLVKQAEVLNEIAGESAVDPATLEKARASIEHDMAFYALTAAEVRTLYDQLIAQSQAQGIPNFDSLDLEVTPEARAATEYIIGLLTRQ